MARVGTPIPARLEKRMCLRCGYRGRALQGERAMTTFQCPSCHADLYARPPRSYAEMEGLDGALDAGESMQFVIPVDRHRATAGSGGLSPFWRRVEQMALTAMTFLIAVLLISALLD